MQMVVADICSKVFINILCLFLFGCSSFISTLVCISDPVIAVLQSELKNFLKYDEDFAFSLYFFNLRDLLLNSISRNMLYSKAPLINLLFHIKTVGML